MTNLHEIKADPAMTASPVLLGARERRRDVRRPIQAKATVTVLDGPGAGAAHEVQARDLSLSGISFLLREPLAVGQTCRIDMHNSAMLTSHVCEVVRARLLSNGRHEIGVKFRKAA